MNYKTYQNTRDTVWKFLLENEIKELPIDIEKICKFHNIGLIGFQKGRSLIGLLANKSEDGFTTVLNGKHYIFYNENKIAGRKRFTIAHELGHIFLHDNDKRFQWRLSDWNCDAMEKDPKETQANIFASRLLAPMCVLHELNIQTAEQLMQITGLSHQAAQIRFERLQMLRSRSRFYMSPLEIQVYNQFKDYIDKNKLK